MGAVNYQDYIGLGIPMLLHSAKGSTWEEHKYIKRIDGTYYYPDGYEGGRHLSDSQKDKKDDKSEEKDEDAKKGSEFHKTFKDLVEKGEAFYDADEIKNMSPEDFRDLYEDIMQTSAKDISDESLKKMLDQVKSEIEPSNDKLDLTEKDIGDLANEVIRGNFGNGQVRKDLLGPNYEEVQKKVNEIIRSQKSKSSIKSNFETAKKGRDAIDKVLSEPPKSAAAEQKKEKSINLNSVYSVYKQKRR